MFDVISTAKNTQWNSFPTLCSKYSYSHVANEAVDFQVIPGKNCFVEFNKKFGFELLRTVSKDNKELIQRIKKRQVDDLSCGAISKVNGGEIALGTTTGFVRLFSVQSGDYVPVKFKPDRIGNSVIGLDYSNTDEYLGAVYDSSDINLFGLKTGIKTDTFRFDGVSTMVRFHPVRKFALAIGSYGGAITMLDIQTKKKIFHDKHAHTAPIRDISMFGSSQDLFVSCGYDCNINVYDLRTRTTAQQHKQSHPMSTVCVSPCGTFCVAGNLKGDITSYDFRCINEPLDTKRVHERAVVRVAFVPTATSNSNLTLDHTANTTNLEMAASMSVVSPHQPIGRESFAKFVDVCHYNNLAATDLATPKNRDSWADLMPGRKVHDFSMDSIVGTPSRMSMGWENRSELRLKRVSQTPIDIQVAEPDDGEDFKTPLAGKGDFVEVDRFGALNRIQEETDTVATRLEDIKPLATHNNNHLTKVNVQRRRNTFRNSFMTDIKNASTSSPTFQPTSHRPSETESAAALGAATLMSPDSLRSMLTEVVDQNVNATRSRMASHLKAAEEAMDTHMYDERMIGAAAPMEKLWLHKVDHTEFATAFADYVKRVFDDENADAMKSDLNKQNREAFVHYEEDKENCQNNRQSKKSATSALVESITQTPNRRESNAQQCSGEMVTINTGELNQMLNEILTEKLAVLETEYQNILPQYSV